MQLIIDANILIASFLKSALTRELILDEEIELFAPEYFTMEVLAVIKTNKSLKKRIRLSQEEIDILISSLMEHIKIIPEEEYRSFMAAAKQHVPSDDSPYLALSLSLNIPIWSNDLAFQKQTLVKAYSTLELTKLFRR